MKRTEYLVKDSWGNVRARTILPEEEPLRLEPWMLHNINTRGWRVESMEARDSGVEIHGWADWRSVADNLATVVRALLDDSVALSDEESQQLLADAQIALDDYHTAVMEVGLTQTADEPEEGTDGSD